MKAELCITTKCRRPCQLWVRLGHSAMSASVSGLAESGRSQRAHCRGEGLGALAAAEGDSRPGFEEQAAPEGQPPAWPSLTRLARSGTAALALRLAHLLRLDDALDLGRELGQRLRLLLGVGVAVVDRLDAAQTMAEQPLRDVFRHLDTGHEAACGPSQVMQDPRRHVGRQLLVDDLLEFVEGVERSNLVAAAQRREDVGIAVDALLAAEQFQRRLWQLHLADVPLFAVFLRQAPGPILADLAPLHGG